MAKILRIDYSEPPPGYHLHEGEDCNGEPPDMAGVGGCLATDYWPTWYWVCEDDAGPTSREKPVAIADAWADYKVRNNPPGMWSGFYARLPDLDAFSPRMGIHFGIELIIRDRAEYLTSEEAIAAGRVAAWKRHDEWLREAPEKSLSAFIRDQGLAALAMVAPEAPAAHPPGDVADPEA